MQKAAIITIGDELLIGQVIDTNSAWLARELNKIGIYVTRRVAIGDNGPDIKSALNRMSDNQLVIITGGLGPTADDITKPTLLEYFGGSMQVHQPTLEHIKYLWTEVFKRKIEERNLKQAEVPSSCRVLLNTSGTAPGMWFEKNGTIYISLPGVPYEMKTIMEQYGFDEIKKSLKGESILHRTMETFGTAESIIAERLTAFESSLPPFIHLAYLPHYGIVRLRLTGTHQDQRLLSGKLDEKFNQLHQLIEDILISDKDQMMNEIVYDLLLKKKKRMATAESCTGGYIAHLITSIPGSSNVYIGSAITYSNDMKKKMLGVSPETLQKNGAVSEQVVVEMVTGLLKLTGADYGVAVSGIMGPGGGTPDKPVGTVWIAAGSAHNIDTSVFHFRLERQQNIELTAMNALNMLRKSILNDQ